MSSTKTFVSLKQKYDRIIILVDMDCFYCQVEEQLDSKLKGKPIAVVQYLENAGIIAVNYTARAKGVTRHMREKEAKAACPELICVKVPCLRGKADLKKYRDAGLEVAKVLQTFTTLLERASVDEAYLDITESVLKRCTEMNEGKYTFKPEQFVNNHAVGFDNFGNFIQNVTESVGVDNDRISEEDKAAYGMSKLKLLIGASIVTEIRQAVRDKTGYTCSAGIAHNKILAKFTAGLNKPNKQTILPIDSISGLFQDLPISKVKSLGGKLGEEICTSLNIKTMNDLLAFSEMELKQRFEERVGSWLFLMARGIDLEQVTPKFNAKSISCSKRFVGKNAITSIHTLNHWLKELSQEIIERLEKDSLENDRTSRHMTVSFTQQIGKKDVASSRNCPLNGSTVNAFDIDRMTKETFDTIKRSTDKFLKAEGMVIMTNPIKFLGITAGKFENNDTSSGSVQSMFKNHTKKPLSVNSSNTSPKLFGPSSAPSSPVLNSVHDTLKKYQVPKKDKMMSTLLSPKHNTTELADESIENCKEEVAEKMNPETIKNIDIPTKSKRLSKFFVPKPTDVVVDGAENVTEKLIDKVDKEPITYEEPHTDIERTSFTEPIIVIEPSTIIQQKLKYDEDTDEDLENVQETKELDVPITFIKCSEHFEGDHGILGFATLKYWITEIALRLSKHLEKDSFNFNRSPKDLSLLFHQQIETKQEIFDEKFPLHIFEGGVFDAEIVMEVLKRSGELVNSKNAMLKFPVTYLELIADNFEDDKELVFCVKVDVSNSNKTTLVKSVGLLEASFNMNYSSMQDELEEYDENEVKLNDVENCVISNRSEEEYPEDANQSLILIKESVELVEELEDVKIDSENVIEPASIDDIDHESLDDFISDMTASMDTKQPIGDFDGNVNCVIEELTTDEPQNITTCEEKPCSSSSLFENDKKPAYTETYAEFYKPSTYEDLIAHEKCTECGKSVPSIHMTSHIDHHLALQLSQQFRTEFREQIKSRPITAQPTTSKATSTKPKSTTVLKPPANSIHKYTIKDNLDSKDSDDVNKIKCEKCSKYIDNIKYAEHLDYHYAQSLRILDRASVSVTAITKPSENGKRKRPVPKKDAPKMKSLKTFFN